MIRVGCIFNEYFILGGGEISFIDLISQLPHFDIKPIVFVPQDGEVKRKIGEIRNEVIGKPALKDIIAIRDSLLGAETSFLVNSLIKSALDTFQVKYKEIIPEIKKDFREETTFLKKNAESFVFTAGGFIAVLVIIVGFVNRRRKRYQNISRLLTFQIHSIPEQKSYDELTHRIRLKAQESGLEIELRKILGSQGIIGAESWKPEPKKIDDESQPD